MTASDKTRIPDGWYLGLFDHARELLAVARRKTGDKDLIFRILNGRTMVGLTPADCAALLCHVREFRSADVDKMIINASRKLRQDTLGNDVSAMVPIEVTSYCSSSCKFCGWRADNRDMVRSSITRHALQTEAARLAKMGFSHFEIVGGMTSSSSRRN